MDFDTEFPMLSRRQLEAITDFLRVEHEFMAPRSFYTLSSNARNRMHAVSTIAKLASTETMDTYIPYVAVNYFDRFISTNSLSELQGSSLLDKIRLVAICCYTLSAKMRTKNFFQKDILTRREAVYKSEVVMRMEFRILSGLDWRMRSITPFHFLDHYYPTFKRIGGFKRRCINEIIVQSQGEVYFAQFKPSEIAMSALLAATYLGYSSEFTSIERSLRISEDLKACYQEMVDLCRKRRINIRSTTGEVIFSIIPSSSVEASGSQAAELQVQRQSESSTTQFLNMVLDNDDEEEDDENVALLNRRKRNTSEEAVEAPKEVAEGKSEAQKLGEVKQKATSVAGIRISEEKEVEAGCGARQDKGEEKSEKMVESGSGTRDEESKGPCEETVGAESSGAEEDRGKAVDEMSESENELRKRQIKGKGKAVEEAPKEVAEARKQGDVATGAGIRISEEKEVESGSGTRNDVSKVLCKEIVGGESSRAREDKAIDEMFERNRQIRGKSKAALEMLRSKTGLEDAPFRAMNFKVKWPVIVQPGENVDNIDPSLYIDESSITTARSPTTIRGSGNVLPIVSNPCQCTIL